MPCRQARTTPRHDQCQARVAQSRVNNALPYEPDRKRMIRSPMTCRIALALWLHSIAFAAGAQDACLDRAVAAIDIKAAPGQLVVSTLAPDGRRDTRVLAGHDEGSRLDGYEGFRIASITKTYVAATALRLVEDGKLDLQAP